MKKIIIAFDGRHFSEGALNMAAWLNEKQTILVTGIFLSPIDYREMIGYHDTGLNLPATFISTDLDQEEIDSNISRFEEWCEKKELEYRVHKDAELYAIPELITETRFADMLILSSELFYENLGKQQPNEYMRSILHQSECPILLVPEKHHPPENLVIAYDGKPSSVHAIKLFCQLLPELCGLSTLLVTAGENNPDVPDMDRITELLTRHFPTIEIRSLIGETRRSLGRWIACRPGSLLITGAYARRQLFESFKESFATKIIREHNIPVFIAHT